MTSRGSAPCLAATCCPAHAACPAHPSLLRVPRMQIALLAATSLSWPLWWPWALAAKKNLAVRRQFRWVYYFALLLALANVMPAL